MKSDKIQQEKLKMWQDKLQKLLKEYEGIMQRRGEASQMGDLRENSAYQMLSEDAEAWRIRIADVRKIIEKIEPHSAKASWGKKGEK